jgi:hypothetical protein
MDLKIAVAVLVTLTVGVMAVLWLLGKPTSGRGRDRRSTPARPLVPWLASLASQGLGTRLK